MNSLTPNRAVVVGPKVNEGCLLNVCICTFKRPLLLRRLLESLASQETDGRFVISVVVIDNDASASAKTAVDASTEKNDLEVTYLVEAEQNIALARNKAVRHAHGDLVAFIDDDEIPSHNRWLLDLLATMERFGADGALGPVVPSYEEQPAEWVLRGKFHERPAHETGLRLTWKQTRTGNALLYREVFDQLLFRAEFGCDGEDKDFFKRAIEKGFKFVWCSSAPVLENVPRERCQRSFMLRRALMRGRKPAFTTRDIFVSVMAVLLYGLLLPFLLLAGQHVFMKYLIKECDHLGRILYASGIDVIGDAYVTEQTLHET